MAVAVSGKVERSCTGLTTPVGLTAVTPTDRPKLVRYRCVIEGFGGVFYFVTMLFGCFCWCRGFCHRSQISSFLSCFRTSLFTSISFIFKKNFHQIWFHWLFNQYIIYTDYIVISFKISLSYFIHWNTTKLIVVKKWGLQLYLQLLLHTRWTHSMRDKKIKDLSKSYLISRLLL